VTFLINNLQCYTLHSSIHCVSKIGTRDKQKRLANPVSYLNCVHVGIKQSMHYLYLLINQWQTKKLSTSALQRYQHCETNFCSIYWELSEKILSMTTYVGEVKPSVPCRRFAACKRSLNGVEKVSFRQNYRTRFSPTVPPFATRSARVVGGRGSIWRRKWERLKPGESNGKLPLRTCLECSMPEPYRSPDWTLVPAKTGPRAEY
jgi:hypothetical protein